MKVKPRNKALRFAKPTLSAPVRRKATELDQSGLVRMEQQRELLQPLTHRIQEAAGVSSCSKPTIISSA